MKNKRAFSILNSSFNSDDYLSTTECLFKYLKSGTSDEYSYRQFDDIELFIFRDDSGIVVRDDIASAVRNVDACCLTIEKKSDCYVASYTGFNNNLEFLYDDSKLFEIGKESDITRMAIKHFNINGLYIYIEYI